MPNHTRLLQQEATGARSALCSDGASPRTAVSPTVKLFVVSYSGNPRIGSESRRLGAPLCAPNLIRCVGTEPCQYTPFGDCRNNTRAFLNRSQRLAWEPIDQAHRNRIVDQGSSSPKSRVAAE
jgi:hypothetical protein